MRQPLKNRYISSIEELSYYEINLPLFLQLSLDQWKYDERDNLKDCFFEDLYSSINVAENEDRITKEHAKYLRCRFLGL